MENASKALLIAGSILIVILLIAVGMLVYTSANNSIKDSTAQMSSFDIQAFNAKFTSYEGKINREQAKTLLDTIVSHNSVNKDNYHKLVYPVIVINRVYSYATSDDGRGICPVVRNYNDFATAHKEANELFNEYQKNTSNFNVELFYAENGLISAIAIVKDDTVSYNTYKSDVRPDIEEIMDDINSKSK